MKTSGDNGTLDSMIRTFSTLAAGLTAASLALTPSADAQTSTTAQTAAGAVQVDTLARGLNHPWGLAFLPDGRMLVTERPGHMRIVDMKGQVSKPLENVPKVFARGQGGLLDVALAPDFAASRLIYFTYAEPGPGSTAGTAVGRAKLSEAADALEGVEVIFRQEPKVDGSNHFGSRLQFSKDGKLFVALAERFKFEPAQDLSNHLGKILRIEPDGSAPSDNPFVDRPGAKPEIWSYGHRNIQAAALNPETGDFFVAEMGPAGGDELNLVERGRNYGWPFVSWGKHYDGRAIPLPSTRPDLTDALMQWTPVIAPSGMTIYTGSLFPAWRGSILIGGLAARGIVRVEANGRTAREAERIPLGARTRDVRQGPDGAVYALTDETDGRILRLRPAPGR